ncbi:hypothetical protein E2C01_034877 [Portunus trituberculatus]|uniref:Uncharacterized protein n=1 Tax=Portunus trituberculatus TaxID=210409 RepID=A0A5B7F1Q2_PORTR|nr:hypothetical protein [Portunus trituberculatus]
MREAAGRTLTAAASTDPEVSEEKGLLFPSITVTRVLSFEGLPLDDDGWEAAREARRRYSHGGPDRAESVLA